MEFNSMYCVTQLVKRMDLFWNEHICYAKKREYKAGETACAKADMPECPKHLQCYDPPMVKDLPDGNCYGRCGAQQLAFGLTLALSASLYF